MRTPAIVAVSVIYFLVSACRETSREPEATNSLVEGQLHTLLDEREYFKLRSLLIAHGDDISENKKLYFTAFVENAFNHNGRSAELADQLLKDQNLNFSDTLKANLWLLLRDDYIKTFNYAKAAEAGRQALKYKYVFDEKRHHDIENLQLIYEGLSSSRAQRVELREGIVVEWKRDKVGLMNVPVKTSGVTFDFVFDTRASISTIMRSYAERLNLRMLNVHYKESSGITGKTFNAQLAIADSLYIGDLMVRHVVFQVLPDSILSFPSLEYEISGLIGFPVIKELKELHIRQDGKMIISVDAKNSTLQNLAFDESTTVLSLRTPKDTLSFHFDSGATSSILYFNYFKKFEYEVKNIAKRDSIDMGGVGGLERRAVYFLPSFELFIGDKVAKFKDMQVLTRPSYPNQKYYGNLGQDFIAQFPEMILNFENMYVEFR